MYTELHRIACRQEWNKTDECEAAFWILILIIWAVCLYFVLSLKSLLKCGLDCASRHPICMVQSNTIDIAACHLQGAPRVVGGIRTCGGLTSAFIRTNTPKALILPIATEGESRQYFAHEITSCPHGDVTNRLCSYFKASKLIKGHTLSLDRKGKFEDKFLWDRCIFLKFSLYQMLMDVFYL